MKKRKKSEISPLRNEHTHINKSKSICNEKHINQTDIFLLMNNKKVFDL